MMRGIALALAFAGLAPGCAADRPHASATPLQIGVKPEPSEYQPGTFAELCRAGDADACVHVAVDHRIADAENREDSDSPLRGLEGAESDQAVRKLLEDHCWAGHARACAEVASTYPFALGGDEPTRARNELMRKLFLERACDEGDSSACMLLAGDFVADEEPGVAGFYWLRACELGDRNDAEVACKAIED